MTEKVTTLEEFMRQLPRFHDKENNQYFYRGQNNADFLIIPSVMRGRNKGKEDIIYNYAMTECSTEFDGLESHIDILSKMQHYGVPTRLLDITSSPLMALYFACEDGVEKCDNCPDITVRCDRCGTKPDGAVYLFKPKKDLIKPYDSDSIEILSSLPRFTSDDKRLIEKRLFDVFKVTRYDAIPERLTFALKKTLNITEEFNNTDSNCILPVGANNYEERNVLRRLLHEIKKVRPSFESIINPFDLCSNFVCIPRKNNTRIIRQSGAFIVYGLNESPIQETASAATNQLSYSKKIVIDGVSRSRILEQLRLYGMTKGTVYPELYKVAEYIKENIDKPYL